MAPRPSPRRALVAITTCLLLDPAGAAALTDEDVVRPHVDQIALCREGLDELARQAALAAAELDAWTAFHRGLEAELGRGIARIAEEHARLRAVAGTGLSSAPALRPLGSDQSYVPQIGWGVFGFFEKHRADTEAAIAAAEAAIDRGETAVHVASQGWLTGQGLAGLLSADAAAVAALRAAVDAGTWAAHVPALGWVTRQSLEGCIAEQERQIADLRRQIAAGEYTVHLPHLGWVTRKGVEAMIAEAEAELAGLMQARDAGTLTIARDRHGWFNRQGLDAWAKGNEDARAAIEASVAAGTFTHALPAVGWVSGQGLDGLIAAAEKGIADVEQAAAEGRYGVPSVLGWFDRTALAAALALPDCRPQGPSPCLPPEHRPIHADSLARLPVAVAADIAIRRHEVQRLETWRAAIGAHATPDLERLAVERGIFGVLSAEFDQELARHRARIERRIDWLRASLEEIP